MMACMAVDGLRCRLQVEWLNSKQENRKESMSSCGVDLTAKKGNLKNQLDDVILNLMVPYLLLSRQQLVSLHCWNIQGPMKRL